ncbi:MAG: hypothetical protein K2L61_02015 [Clostridia bacterium]|nr:hypothetical protein [Clostridia bacterium]
MKVMDKSNTYANIIKEIESRGKNMATLSVFSDRAREQGYFTVADRLDLIARQESEHCRVLYRIMQEGDEVDTLANLIYCAGQLHASAKRLKDAFAVTARQEGFEYVAKVIEEVANVDSATEEDLKGIMSDLKVGKLYKDSKIVKWQCIKCGYASQGADAPEICPLCSSQKGFFQKLQK